MKPTVKESPKEIFLKNVGLQPIKIQRPMEEKNDINIHEGICFYYLDDDKRVICRRCHKKFNKWFNYRLHFNTLSCHITQRNYKLNTYNDVYKKYKLKKSKTKKKMNNHVSASKLMDLETLNTRKTRKRYSVAQIMDLETLNTRKTRNRCYQNTKEVVTVSKSSSDPGSINSKKATVKTFKKEGDVIYISSDEGDVIYISSDEGDIIYISSDEGVEESNTKPNGCDIIKVQDIPNSTNTIITKSPNDNQMMLTVKTKRNADELSQISSDSSSSSVHFPPKYIPQKSKALKYQYVCVICDAQFINKCSFTIHQGEHIKSDPSRYSVIEAEIKACRQEKK